MATTMAQARLPASVALRFAILATAFFGAMALDLTPGEENGGLLMAPEIGFALGGLILFGTRIWPAVWLASVAASALFAPEVPMIANVVMGLSEALAALAGAIVLQRLGWPAVRRTSMLLIAGGVTIVLDSAGETLIHAAAGSLAGWGAESTWLASLVREGLGMLVTLPLVIVWARRPVKRWNAQRIFHFVFILLGTVALASQVAFGEHTSAFAWTLFPALVWSALAFRRRGATLSIFLTAIITTAGTALGHGPFEVGGDIWGVPLGQLSLGATAAAMYALAGRADASAQEARARLAEHGLREREHRLELFLDNAPAAIAIFDREMCFVGASRRFLDVYGLPSQSDVIGKSLYDLSPISLAWRDFHIRTLAGDNFTGKEDPFRRPDGTLDYVTWSLRPWRNPDGAIAGVILLTELVTQQVETRKRIEAAEARYRAVFEQAAVGVCRTGLDGRYLEVNDRFCEIFGRTRDEMIGMHFADATHEADREANLDALRDMLAGIARTYTSEKRVIRGDGTVAWVSNAVRLVRDTRGGPDCFVSVVTDITERRRVESALQESEKRLRLAQEAAGVGVWEFDLDRGIAIHSPVSARMHLLPADTNGVFTFEQLASHFDPAIAVVTREKVTRSVQHGELYDHVLYTVTPEGRRRWIHSIGRFDSDSGPLGRMLGVSIDITAFHEAQGELIQAHEKLLRVSRLSAMGAMASTLAHELNQPLAAAANYTQACRQMLAMRNVDGDEPLVEMLDLASAQSLRAGEIIRKMRRFTVDGEIAPQSEDLHVIVAQACTQMRERPQAQGVLITTDIDPGVKKVMVDRTQIEQVLANLIRNAVEAMQDSPERRVEIHAEGSQDMVEIRVSDTGPGIPAEALATLFEPFRSSKEQGMGLGLSICRTIVEAHGGRLWAESPPGGGAIFHLTLRRARATDSARVH